MGKLYIEGLMEVENDIDTLLTIHLENNHYPPVSLKFIPTCKQALECANDCAWDKKIKMPNGRTLTAGQIVEGLHLDSFLETEDI